MKNKWTHDDNKYFASALSVPGDKNKWINLDQVEKIGDQNVKEK